jgi:hypothetical protein
VNAFFPGFPSRIIPGNQEVTMPGICHFEVPAEDMERAKTFWRGLLGWELEDAKEFEGYTMIRTRMGDGSPGIGGGMVMRQHPEQQIMNYFDVKSVEEYVELAKSLGGKVIMEKTAVPGMGWFAVCMDTENNVFGLWEDDESAK